VTWRFVCGLLRGGLVYVHATGTRAYVHVDDAGDVDVVGWDGGRERHFPEREALEAIVAHDLQRIDPAVLRLVGFDEFRTVRSYRGRKKKWDAATLGELLEAVERDGVRAVAEQWGLSEGRVRELRRQARSIQQAQETIRSPSEQADWHRASYRGLERMRGVLHANWARQQRESK